MLRSSFNNLAVIRQNARPRIVIISTLLPPSCRATFKTLDAYRASRVFNFPQHHPDQKIGKCSDVRVGFHPYRALAKRSASATVSQRLPVGVRKTLIALLASNSRILFRPASLLTSLSAKTRVSGTMGASRSLMVFLLYRFSVLKCLVWFKTPRAYKWQ